MLLELEKDAIRYCGPVSYAIADWRRAINDLYANVRATADPEQGWRLWHRRRSELFRFHPMSPIAADRRKNFGSIPVFPYDPNLRFDVDLVAGDGGCHTYDLGKDGQMTAREVARTDGLAQTLGSELTVYWITGYGGGLFIPFRDATASAETFGGGRYLVDAIKGADLGLNDEGRLILDFNFAYNPSCALNQTYICPLSPPENRLGEPVRAGEKTFPL